MAVRSRRRTVFSLLLTIVGILFITFVFQHITGDKYGVLVKFRDHLKQVHKDRGVFQRPPLTPGSKEFNSMPPRKNIILMSHGRSGSTMLGDIFNHHPSVFYLHEPLQSVERLMKTANKSYGNLMADFLKDMFHCRFNKSVVEDLEYYYRDPSRSRASHVIGSPPLCPYEVTDPRWEPNLCPPMTSEILGNVCRNNYAVNAAKVLTRRIAEKSLKNILAACNPSGVDCKIIFLIRDPRASIGSARRIGFFKNAASDTDRKSLRRYSSTKCQETEQNLAFVKNLPLHWRDRIMIQRYEDFAMNPLKGLSRLYKFAGLPVIESVKAWLHNATNSANSRSEMCKSSHHALCTVDDPSQAVKRWRWKIPLSDVDIIEHHCKEVMRFVGYKPVNGSQELLSNISIPLFSEDYEVKGWFHG